LVNRHQLGAELVLIVISIKGRGIAGGALWRKKKASKIKFGTLKWRREASNAVKANLEMLKYGIIISMAVAKIESKGNDNKF